jgi:hypothetical protein
MSDFVAAFSLDDARNPVRQSCVAASRVEATRMRSKTPAVWLTLVLKLASHTAMGVAMGLVFTLVLSLADPTGTLMRRGAAAGITWSMFVATVVLTFAIGATLTGLVFNLSEDR